MGKEEGQTSETVLISWNTEVGSEAEEEKLRAAGCWPAFLMEAWEEPAVQGGFLPR